MANLCYIAPFVLFSTIPTIYSTEPNNTSELHMNVSPSIIDLDYSSNGSQIGLPSGHHSSYYLQVNKSQLEEIRHEYEQSSADTYRFERIFYAFAYGLIIVLSLFGNLLVCRVCLRTMTKTNALIMSLAASDLLMTTCNIPFGYFRLLEYSWPFGGPMCFVVSFVKYMVVYNSSYTMAIIAIQRYCSVCCCLSSFQPNLSNGHARKNSSSNSNSAVRRKCSKCQFHQFYSPMRVIYITIATTWIISASIATFFTFSSKVVARKDLFTMMLSGYINSVIDKEASPPQNDYSSSNLTETNPVEINSDEDGSLMHFTYRCTNQAPDFVTQFLQQKFSITQPELTQSIVVFLTQYFIPLSVSCALYIRIGKTISKQGKLVQNIKGNSRAQIQQRHKRRRITMLVLVVAVFAICWLPLHLFHICTDAGVFNYNYQVYMMVHWLAMSSVCYNPFIYCWLNKAFRKAAMRVFCCIKEELNYVMTHGNLSEKRHSRRTSSLKSNNLNGKSQFLSVNETKTVEISGETSNSVLTSDL